MIYRKRGRHSTTPGGYFRFHNTAKSTISGYGEGDYIRLKDEFGQIWRGSAERDSEGIIRYRFKDENGRTITGMSDTYGVVLRDEKGKSWRGFVD